MDATGKILHRDRRKAAKPAKPAEAPQNENWITIPLPDEPVPIGHTWSIPQDIDVPLESGGVKKIKAIQQFTLEEVKTGVATIRFSTDCSRRSPIRRSSRNWCSARRRAGCGSTSTRAAS